MERQVQPKLRGGDRKSQKYKDKNINRVCPPWFFLVFLQPRSILEKIDIGMTLVILGL